MSENTRESLAPGTLLDCYRVVKLIGSGGFSLIYLAEDEDSHDEVAIKEYIPKRFGKRVSGDVVTVTNPNKHANFERGRKLFYQEANVLAMLRHDNIVSVRNCFLDNGTAYMAMDYEPGKNLGLYIKRRKGRLSTHFLMKVFPPLLDALDLIHSKQHLHLDIKPSNVHLRPGGDPILLDFGAAYHLDDVGEKKAQVITPGFSPIEQYYATAKVGPWTDVYAIGASIRSCIEGKSPPSSVERHAKDTVEPATKLFSQRYPMHILEAIDWAMQIDAENRPQTAGELRDALTQQISIPKFEAS